MAATPFKGTLSGVNRKGEPVDIRYSFSDVANVLGTLDDYAAVAGYVVPQSGFRIVDFTLTAAGVDTTNLQFRKNTTDLPTILRGAKLANLTTDVASRIGMLRGKPLEPGATYFIKQLA